MEIFVCVVFVNQQWPKALAWPQGRVSEEGTSYLNRKVFLE